MLCLGFPVEMIGFFSYPCVLVSVMCSWGEILPQIYESVCSLTRQHILSVDPSKRVCEHIRRRGDWGKDPYVGYCCDQQNVLLDL